jgi:hypothetical protein
LCGLRENGRTAKGGGRDEEHRLKMEVERK